MGSAYFEQLAPEFNRPSFREIFPDVDTFYNCLAETEAVDSELTEDNLKKLYYMLIAKYGNTPIRKADGEEWLYDLIFTINAHYPTFLKKDEIQRQLRALNLDDLRDGTKSIFNHAYNPSQTPSTGTSDEIPYVNEQNVNKLKKNKADALSSLWEILHTNIMDEFIKKFKNLFSKILTTTNHPVYIMEEEEE